MTVGRSERHGEQSSLWVEPATESIRFRRTAMTRRWVGWLVLAWWVGIVSGSAAADERPRIGLVYTHAQSQQLRAGRDARAAYRRAIEAAGGRAVLLRIGESPALLDRQLEWLDGLLLPGGEDVEPLRYGQTTRPACETIDHQRDAFEWLLLGVAVRRRLPVFGICRGLQVINVYFGGTLYQDLPTEFRGEPPTSHRQRIDGRNRTCRHPVTIVPGSQHFALLATTSIEVNSYHHQGIASCAPPLRVTVRSPDGLAEGIEGRSGTPAEAVLAVQFHPELLVEAQPVFRQYFLALVDAARVHRDRRNRGSGRGQPAIPSGRRSD